MASLNEELNKYINIELAKRIDKSTDIVSRQEDTINEVIIDAKIEILEAIEALSRKIDIKINFQPISDEQIDSVFETSYVVKRCSNLDATYNKCVWAYVYNSTNKSLDDISDPTHVDLNSLYFSDTDEVENNDIILNQNNIQYSIQGYEGDYVTDPNTHLYVFKADLLRIVKAS